MSEQTNDAKKLVYENIGSYDANDVVTAFTQGLEQYAANAGLSGTMRQTFLNAGASLALAIKDGNVTKLTNGDLSINGQYGLNNAYTDEDIQKMKTDKSLGWGAEAYQGDHQRSHGIFTTQQTEDFRDKNHALGLLNNYLTSVLKNLKTDESKAADEVKNPYSFDTAFNSKILGGNVDLLNNWKTSNTSLDARIQSVIDTLNNADYTKWSQQFPTLDETQLRTAAGEIISALQNKDITTASNKAYALGFSIDDYLRVPAPKPEQKQKTEEEVAKETEKKFRDAVIEQYHLENASDEVIDEAVEMVKEANLQRYQETILDQRYNKTRDNKWADLINNPEQHPYSYDWDSLGDQYLLNPAAGSAYDLNVLEKTLKNLTDNKKEKELSAFKDKYINNIHNTIVNSALTIQDQARLLDQLEKAGVAKDNQLYATALQQLYINAAKFAKSFNYINNFYNLGMIDGVNIGSYFAEVKDGPYKGWIIISPSELNGNQYSLIFNNDRSSADYGKIKRVKQTLIDKSEFDAEYEKNNPRPKAEFVLRHKEGGTIEMGRSGWVAPTKTESTTTLPIEEPVTEKPEENKSSKKESTTSIADDEITEEQLKKWAEGDFSEAFSASDWARLGGLIGDFVSLAGGPAALGGGVVSILSDGSADVMDWINGKQTGLLTLGNIGQNIGLSILSLIPGAGAAKALKGTKYISTAGKLLKRSAAIAAAAGLLTDIQSGEAMQSINNVLSGKVTMKDARNIVNLLSAVTSLSGKHPKQNNKYYKQSSASHYGMKGNVTVKTAQGKDVTLTHELYKQLVDAAPAERNNVFKSFQTGDTKLDLPSSALSEHAIGKWFGKNKNGVLDITSDNRVMTPRTYIDYAGNTREVAPDWFLRTYLNGHGAPLVNFDWAKRAAQKINTQGKIIKLPEGTTKVGDLYKTPQGNFFKEDNGYFTSVNKPEKHLKGGVFNFATNVVEKFAGGGGIRQNKSWLDSGGREALSELLQRLSNTEKYGDQYWATINEAQDLHSAMREKSNFANTKGSTFWEDSSVKDYQDRYNKGGWNDIAIWPHYNENFTATSAQSEGKDTPTGGGIDSKYSGVTDYRHFGRKGDFEGKEEELKLLQEKFRNAGYNYELDDKTGYYKLSKLKLDNPDLTSVTATSTSQGDNTQDTGNSGSTETIVSATTTPEGEATLTPTASKTINWGNLSDAARVMYLNALNTRATKTAMNYKIPEKGFIHRLELLEGNYPVRQEAQEASAQLNTKAATPFTSDASLQVGAMLSAADKGNTYKMNAAAKDAERFYETRHRIQELQNADNLENLARSDYNRAQIAAKSLADANMKANNIIHNSNNISNLWAGYNQQMADSLSRRAQLYNTRQQSLAAAKQRAAYQQYMLEANKPGADLEKLTKDYQAKLEQIYGQQYVDMMDTLHVNPFITNNFGYTVTKSAKGSKLTAALHAFLESNKDFNKAMRENRKEFYKNIRGNKRRKG